MQRTEKISGRRIPSESINRQSLSLLVSKRTWREEAKAHFTLPNCLWHESVTYSLTFTLLKGRKGQKIELLSGHKTTDARKELQRLSRWQVREKVRSGEE